MKTTPYTRSDIFRLDCRTFFKVLYEAEKREQEAIEKSKKQTRDE